jgi:alpha-glutamyl/putrescinyl thymine pyrophosphorylase clade 1
MDFVVAGPGARSGIDKCFTDIAPWGYEDVIRWTTEQSAEAFARREIPFLDLWGRQLHLIDCQNLFCEVDKYARVAHPEIAGHSGRTRIKQKYRPDPTPLSYAYPPKWQIRPHSQPNAVSI